jgi:hypothetical protein
VAYRGEDEHDGGLGVEKGPLTRPATSGGALAGNGATVVKREGTEWRLGARGAVPTGVSRSASGGPRRRRMAAMWPASGGARWAPAHGRGEGETRPCGLAGPKGRRSAQQRLPLFLFF